MGRVIYLENDFERLCLFRHRLNHLQAQLKLMFSSLVLIPFVRKIKKEDIQKTDDRLEFNSLVGKKASGYWYYSAFLNFKTQMSSTNVDGVQTSHFFSPAYFQFGPGMLWKKSDNLKVNFAPATSKLIVVHSHLTDFGPAFGVKQGESSRYELGAAVNAYYKLDIMKNISVENILNLYSNYLEDFQNVEID